MNLFNLTLKVKGYPIKKAQDKLREIQALTAVEHERFIIQQRIAIVEHHLATNPYYRQLVEDTSFGAWEDLPILTKSDLQVPLENRLAKGYTAANVYVNKTSGSSGHPFIFAKDKYCHAMTWAQIIDRFSWYDLDFNSSKQARFYGIPLDKKGYYKERLKDALSHRYRFPIFDLQASKLESILEKFTHSKFDYINGYTSSIVLFAKYLKEKGVVLKTVCPTLKVCLVTSEMLFDLDKALMESALGVPVINEYGASELDLIAFTHPKGDFRLNCDTLYIEILDNKNQVVPPGETGRIVVTSLFNKAHPFIRYDIGDIGSLTPNQNTKTQSLKTLVGRTNDIAHLPSGKTVPGLTFYYVTKSIIEKDGNVKEFVVTQTAKDRFLIQYVSAKALLDSEIEHIKKALSDYLEPGLQLEFRRLEVLERSGSGKLKQFISKING